MKTLIQVTHIQIPVHKNDEPEDMDMNEETGFYMEPHRDDISNLVEKLSRTYYNSSFPIDSNNILANSLFKYEHIRRRYIYDSIPFSIDIHSQFITTDTSNLKDIDLNAHYD